MVVAAQKGNFVHLKCYAHTVNLASQKALKLAAVAKLLARIRRISTFFHHSTLGKHLLGENQKLLGLKRHKLKTDVCTRWNSAYDMTDRFLEQQPAIAATLLSPQEKNPTVCLIAPVHAKLIENTEPNTEDSPLVRDIKKAINGDLRSRYNREAEKNLLYTASALDSRCKSLSFLSDEEREQTYGRVIAGAASLEREVRMEEETREDNGAKATVTTEEGEEVGPPPAKRKSTLLDNLLGLAFTSQAVEQPKSAYARAQEEMTKYCLAETPSLQEDPLRWWNVHQVPNGFLPVTGGPLQTLKVCTPD
ncbi:hypothetical protein GJAV_G00015240 [Gymnothorax javanicus]|nr:hypothetical protein GJAV_G00015240 [Gymnothorax javanicus]